MRAYLPYQLLSECWKAKIIQILWQWLKERPNEKLSKTGEIWLVKLDIPGDREIFTVSQRILSGLKKTWN